MKSANNELTTARNTPNPIVAAGKDNAPVRGKSSIAPTSSQGLAINLCRDSHHAMMAPIGASKNSIVMLTARFPKRRVRPVGCATKSCSAWENDGDEARFLRFFKLCGEYAAARAPYES